MMFLRSARLSERLVRELPSWFIQKFLESPCSFECPGYMGVKVWPATEHVWGSEYYEKDHQFRPWYFVCVAL